MIVAGRSGAASERPETQVDDVEDYDYDNPADRDAYCPDMDNNDDAYGKQNAPDTDKPDIGNINKNCKNWGYFVSVFCAANHFGLFHCDVGGSSFSYFLATAALDTGTFNKCGT